MNSPSWGFRRLPNGLYAPAGMLVNDTFIPSPDFKQATSAPPMQHMALRSISALPGYSELWTGKPPAIGDLLASAPAFSFLDVLSRIAMAISHELSSPSARFEQTRRFFSLEQQPTIDKLLATGDTVALMHPFPVLLAMELAAARAPQAIDGWKYTDEHAWNALKLVYRVWDEVNEPLQQHLAANIDHATAALFERSAMESPLTLVMRAYGVWKWTHPDLSTDAVMFRGDFEKELQSSTGLSIDEWLGAVFWVVAQRQQQDLQSIGQNIQGLGLPRHDLSELGNRAVRSTLETLSVAVDEFAIRCKEADSRAPLDHVPTLLPLKRAPALVAPDRGSFLVLSPIHLAEAALERPYRIGQTNRVVPEAQSKYARVIESYVHGLLRRVFGERYQPLKPSRVRKRAEGIIWYPDGCIIVECKATRIPEAERLNPRITGSGSYIDELRRLGIDKAVEQIHETSEDVRTGAIAPFPGCLPKTIGSIIVTLHEIPQSAVMSDSIGMLLPRTERLGGAHVLRPQVMTLAQLERIEAMQAMELLAVLKDKMTTDDATLEPLGTFYTMRGYALGKSHTPAVFFEGLMKAVRPLMSDAVRSSK